MTAPVHTGGADPADPGGRAHPAGPAGRAGRPNRTGRTGRAGRVGAVLVVLVALGLVLAQGLGNATVYFRTADEAAAQRSQLGTRRFRIEGVVVPGSVHPSGQGVTFIIASRGVSVPVAHRGDPPELFKAEIPVVLEGHFSPKDPTFRSDLLMVKHSESYQARHPERVTTPVAPAESSRQQL